MSALKKLELVEERLGQLQAFSEDCLREVLRVLGEGKTLREREKGEN